AARLDREDEAAPYRVTVDEHGAGAAHTVLAPEVRAGEPELLAQQVGQGQPRLDRGPAGHTVHADLDLAPDHGVRHGWPPRSLGSTTGPPSPHPRGGGTRPTRGDPTGWN